MTDANPNDTSKNVQAMDDELDDDVGASDEDPAYSDNGSDDEDDDSDPQDDDEILPPIRLAWQCEMIKRLESPDPKKKQWKCLHCNKIMNGHHHTRLLYHVLKIAGNNMAGCTAVIPDKYRRRYQAIYDKSKKRKDAIRAANDEVQELVIAHHDSVHSMMEEEAGKRRPKKRRKKSGQSTEENILNYTTKTPRTGVILQPKKPPPPSEATDQPSIESSMECSMSQTDVRTFNDTQLQIAIADFFYSQAIADSAVESPQFKRMMHCARMVSSTFKCPNRRRLGGDLLKLSYNARDKSNREALLTKADRFGLCVLGDGATLGRKPLLNMLASGATCPFCHARSP